MNIIDVLIVLGIVASLLRGREVGFVRQFFSTAGFFVGLFIGATLQQHTVTLVHGASSKALVTLLTTLGCALIMMALGEYVGLRLKRQILAGRFNRLDISLGSLLAALSLLLVIWLGASIFASLPAPSLQRAINTSAIIRWLDAELPPAPGVVADLGRLIDPNGFPQVFTGLEPAPTTSNVTPSLNGFAAAIKADKASVVKIEGQGCGGIVEGSGFVVGNGLVATNAHVVAGIRRPLIEDGNGTHRATAIWFDPDLDLAILRTGDLAGAPLSFDTSVAANGTRSAVLGYPGGGPFDVSSAVVLDHFIATGRNIYGQGQTERQVYEVNAAIIPGNSGGPLISADGNVIGVVFAESTTYRRVGYTLTAQKVVSEVQAAKARNQVVSTSNCAE